MPLINQHLGLALIHSEAALAGAWPATLWHCFCQRLLCKRVAGAWPRCTHASSGLACLRPPKCMKGMTFESLLSLFLQADSAWQPELVDDGFDLVCGSVDDFHLQATIVAVRCSDDGVLELSQSKVTCFGVWRHIARPVSPTTAFANDAARQSRHAWWQTAGCPDNTLNRAIFACRQALVSIALAIHCSLRARSHWQELYL